MKGVTMVVSPSGFTSITFDGIEPAWLELRSALEQAGEVGDWVQAAELGKQLFWSGDFDKAVCLVLADACRHLGEADLAQDVMLRLQLSFPGDDEVMDACHALQRWLAWRDELDWVDGREFGEAELYLEPLALHHCSEFFEQYADPEIAERCALPVFASVAAWQEWLWDIDMAGVQRLCAVLHRECGFVGCVSLQRHGGIGCFYYWIGQAFRGQGWGPRAVRLLLCMAERRYGMDTCYSAVYADNMSSRRALTKLGFVDLDITAQAPEEQAVFYRRGAFLKKSAIAIELHELMEAMASQLRPAVILQL